MIFVLVFLQPDFFSAACVKNFSKWKTQKRKRNKNEKKLTAKSAHTSKNNFNLFSFRIEKSRKKRMTNIKQAKRQTYIRKL